MTAPVVAATEGVVPGVLHFVPQSAADLRYFLYPTMLDGAAWQILDRTVVAIGAGSLDLAIIGSSHVLTLRVGDAVLTEVLACLPSGSTTVPPITMRAARGHWQVQAPCGPAMWATHFEERHYSSSAAFSDAQGLILTQRPTLVRQFPQGPYPLPPLTAINYGSVAEEAQLTTWHTYPQERVIAVTRTVITIR